MLALNLKDFLTDGAFLQVSPNRFKILIGPFEPVSIDISNDLESNVFLYSSNFWEFLNNGKTNAQNFVYRAARSFEVNREDFIGLLIQHSSNKPMLKWEPVQESGFKEQFDKSQNWFSKTQLKKTVPVILQESFYELEPAHKIYLLNNLLENKNYGWSYGYFNKTSSMLGFTPEILLSWNNSNQVAQTVALAGTLAKIQNAQQLILNDFKIKQEHEYVINDISEKLISLNFLKKPTAALELKHLVHLKTDFEVSIKNLTEALNVVHRLHPTAAMGIYPSPVEKLQEFSQFELQSKRGLFASPFGVFDQNSLHIVVSIRNIIFNKAKVQIFSGCGITEASRYDLELVELENKRNSVKKMLGLWDDQL